MKKEIEVSAKTREEAIEKAVVELGAPSAAAIMYTVINEGRRGFLGFGAVDCTIKAIYQVPDPVEEKPRRERRDRNDRRDRGDRKGGDRRDRRDSDRAPKKTEEETETVEVTSPVIPPVENIDPSTATESELYSALAGAWRSSRKRFLHLRVSAQRNRGGAGGVRYE